jgi:hypothetical protein
MVLAGAAKNPDAIGQQGRGNAIPFSGLYLFAVNGNSKWFLLFYIKHRMPDNTIHKVS